MKVILVKSVSKIGSKGETIEVKAGYARNFLIPKGLAVAATKGAKHNAKLLKSKEEKTKQELVSQADTIEKKLAGKSIPVTAKAGEGGQLFGAVSSKDISEVITKEIDLDIPANYILIDEDIKSVGEHKVKLRLTPEKELDLQVEVSPANEK